MISALDGGKWSVSRPGHFIPRERSPVTHLTGGWVVLRAGLDAVVKRKIPIPRLVAIPTELSRLSHNDKFVTYQ